MQGREEGVRGDRRPPEMREVASAYQGTERQLKKSFPLEPARRWVQQWV